MTTAHGAIVSALVVAAAISTVRPDASALAQNDPKIAALLEPIRAKHGFPALGGAIVTSKGLSAMAVTGVRKAGATVAATPDDLWHLGSDTKAMTAVVIAKLVERGKLTWDATIEAVLPKPVANSSPTFGGITLLELLSHRAGLAPNVDWNRIEKTGGTLTAQREATVALAASTKLQSPPGTKYEYSNTGYVIAAAMAEEMSGRPWEELIRDIVFKPLGMTSAGFGGTGTPGQIDQPWPHTGKNQPARINGPETDNPPVMGPAGTVHCSLADWSKFMVDQLRGLKGQGALLKPETYTRLHTAPFNGDYAFGWLVTERPWAGGVTYTHAGSNTANFAVVWIAPARDFAVLIVTNQGGNDAQIGTDEAASELIRLQIAGL